MEAVGIIPARFFSQRFEGKVLADILGKPMIQHVWERARGAKSLDRLIVACDDERVRKAVLEFGGEAVMTAKEHGSGTERATEVIRDLEARIVVNIQADEPLLHPAMIDSVVYTLLDHSQIPVATLRKRITDEAEILDSNTVKVVVDKKENALYFSRCPIPFIRQGALRAGVHYKHIGLYAYTKDFLFTYKNLTPTRLEELERLEQLRILESGYPIRVIETMHDCIGVDTHADLERVKERLLVQPKEV